MQEEGRLHPGGRRTLLWAVLELRSRRSVGMSTCMLGGRLLGGSSGANALGQEQTYSAGGTSCAVRTGKVGARD